MGSQTLADAVRFAIPRGMRNWLRAPSKSAAWLWDSVQFSLGVTRRLPLAPDWTLICHPYAYKVAQRDQVSDPNQAAEFQNFLSSCGNSMFLLDIGAHFGVFSLAAAHFGGRAIAVDPSPIATRMIHRQAVLNGCTDRIRIIQAAVSETNGVTRMLESGVFSDGYFQVANDRPERELTTTPSFTIDSLVSQFGDPSHIKIDVEGHEAAVLRSAGATLGRYSPTLYLELHNEMVAADGGDPRLTLDLLEQFGFTTFGLNGELVGRESILSKPIARVVARKMRA
jgi:FkbM family methyltransferase